MRPPSIAGADTLPKAEKIFDSLVNSKMKKGYVPDDALTDNVATQLIANKESIGFKPMLSNPVSPQEIASRIEGGEWFMASMKADGERRPIHIHGGEVFAGNRRGERVPLREDFANALIKWAEGLDQPLVLSQEPGSSEYVLHSGGNTRLTQMVSIRSAMPLPPQSDTAIAAACAAIPR